MKNRAWKLAVQTTILVLCGLIVWSAYLASSDRTLIQERDRRSLAASASQAKIAGIGFDLQQMETSQRGYLLTGDSDYLKPYQEASGRLEAELAALRTTLGPRDLPVEAQFESVVKEKTAEMQETIRLRQQGYRHRAFVIVGSNRGMKLMEEARASLEQLSSAQARDVARNQQEVKDGAAAAARRSGYANASLLGIAVLAFFAFRGYSTRIERAYARHDQELKVANQQLQRFTTTMFGDFRASIDETQDHATAVLDSYGGYLPRQANEKLEQIRDGARRMTSTLEGLSAIPAASRTGHAVEVAVSRLSA